MRSSVVPSPRHTTRSDPSRPARKTESRTSHSPSPGNPDPRTSRPPPPTRPPPAPTPSPAGTGTPERPGPSPGRLAVAPPARDGIGAGEGLVGEGEREVLDSVFLAGREGSDR